MNKEKKTVIIRVEVSAEAHDKLVADCAKSRSLRGKVVEQAIMSYRHK